MSQPRVYLRGQNVWTPSSDCAAKLHSGNETSGAAYAPPELQDQDRQVSERCSVNNPSCFHSGLP
jgi:hypothetical protein